MLDSRAQWRTFQRINSVSPQANHGKTQAEHRRFDYQMAS
jgi:hypothetical protein